MAFDGAWLQTRLLAIKECFSAHPRATGETYGEHLCFALSVAGRLAVAVFTALVHGVFPFWFTYATSRQLDKVNAIIAARKARVALYIAEEAKQPEDA